MIDFFSEDDLREILQMMMQKNTEVGNAPQVDPAAPASEIPLDDRTPIEKKADEESEDLYSVKNFSL